MVWYYKNIPFITIFLERAEGNKQGNSDSGVFLTTRFGKRSVANNDIDLSDDFSQDGILLGREFWLPKNTARDLDFKMQNLQDYMARYYDNTRSKDFLRL